MTSKRPYIPAKAASRGPLPGTDTFSRLSRRRWSLFSNLGTWTVRDMRNKPGTMSQHASGRALDLGYPATKAGRAAALEALTWYVDHADELGIALLNDYVHGDYGRTWISNRAAWRVHTRNTIGIRYHGIHLELHEWAAKLPADKYEKLWRDIPRP